MPVQPYHVYNYGLVKFHMKFQLPGDTNMVLHVRCLNRIQRALKFQSMTLTSTLRHDPVAITIKLSLRSNVNFDIFKYGCKFYHRITLPFLVTCKAPVFCSSSQITLYLFHSIHRLTKNIL